MFKKRNFLLCAGLIIFLSAVSPAQDMPEFPKPVEEHRWLQQLTGEWKATGQCVQGPDQPPMTSEGTENIRGLGELWIISESETRMGEFAVQGQLVLGYDAKEKKFIGTWIDSVTGQLWQYEGTRDASGKVLTLLTKGQCPMQPGRQTQFREVLEVKDKNYKIFTSSFQDPEGNWIQFSTIEYRRKS